MIHILQTVGVIVALVVLANLAVFGALFLRYVREGAQYKRDAASYDAGREDCRR